MNPQELTPNIDREAPTRLSRWVELRQLGRLALPLMGAQIAQMSMGVVDAVMAGNYSSVDLAGVALGGSVFWPFLLLMMGLIQAVTPMVSQLNGAQRHQEIGEFVRQGLWLAVIGGLTVAFIITHIESLYRFMQVDPAALEISIAYLERCAFGVPALMCFFCLRFLADGMGFTRPALLIAISALALKIPLNYIFIYGAFGLPEMGGVGAGLAQAMVMWLQFTLILIVVTRKRFAITGWMHKFSFPQWSHMRRLLVIGIPIGATIFAEVGLFSGTTLLLGRFGADVVASHNIAMNINGVLFMPAMAIGMAATIRIGFRIGAQEIAQARTSAALVIAATSVVALLGSACIYFLRFGLVALYTEDSSVMDLSSQLLLFVVFFLLFDALQATAVGALRGYKDTRTPMLIAMFSYWVVGLPSECALGFGWFGEPMGVYGFWIGLAVGVGTAAVLLCTRLWRVSANHDFIRRLSAT